MCYHMSDGQSAGHTWENKPRLLISNLMGVQDKYDPQISSNPNRIPVHRPPIFGGNEMSNDITYFDATKLAELIRAREVSPVEVLKAHLDRVEEVDPRINAIVTLAGGALEAARAAEAAV